MKTEVSADQTSALQAVQWLHRLEHTSAREREGFAGWLLESRRNVRNFLMLTALDRELAQLDSRRRHDVDALIAEAPGPGADLAGIGEISARRRSDDSAGQRRRSASIRGRFKWPLGLAAAAMLAGVVLAMIFWRGGVPSPTFATIRGEQRSIPLTDGSVIQLNTDSQVRVTFSAQARDIRLLEGEAMFTVRPDAARPFRVDTGNGVVQALGTQFNVYRQKDVVTVSVIDGLVRIDPSGARLAAGEQAQVFKSREVVKLKGPDISRAIAWRERRLDFREDRLQDIAAEFNRYHGARRILVEGAGPQDRRITGVFAADDPKLLMLFLARDPGLVVEEREDEIVIRGCDQSRCRR